MFPYYYAMGNAQHIAWLDALVLARANYVSGLGTPRTGLDDDQRRQLERTTDRDEQMFTGMRDAVRGSDTYQKIPTAERQRMDRELFDAPQTMA